MALKGQIVEQVLRIVNGGQVNDDAKISKQEVGVLLEQERDALVRKTILENATLGEYELPSEFISVHRCKIHVDHLYGGGGRPYVYLPHQPVNLPNDGGIYRVCKVTDVYEGTSAETGWDVRRDKFDVTIASTDAQYHALSNITRYSTLWRNFKAKGSYNIGNVFEFSCLFGYDADTAKQYTFRFNYRNQAGREQSKDLTLHNIDTHQMIKSLVDTPDFQNFLMKNKLRVNVSGGELPTENKAHRTMEWSSIFSDFYMGEQLSTPSQWYFKSVLTNEHVLELIGPSSEDAGGYGIGVYRTTQYTEAADTAGIYGGRGFGIDISYAKNTRLKELGPDLDGMKPGGGTIIQTYIDITDDSLPSEDGEPNFDEQAYGIPTVANLAKMWMNKWAGKLKIYGIRAYIQPTISGGANGATICIEEETPLGGFDWVKSTHQGNFSIAPQREEFGGEYVIQGSERINYREIYCYSRMPNPGLYSKMYDDAILLSGKRFWYRQDSLTLPDQFNQIDVVGPLPDEQNTGRAKLYLYNENPKDIIANTTQEFNDVQGRYPMYINIWMLSKSHSYQMDEEFPVPEDALSEMIKSLVATFANMRAAKEDVINDNVDIA